MGMGHGELGIGYWLLIFLPLLSLLYPLPTPLKVHGNGR
ncbi:hypothetical protein COO91_01777 [Nostoc flagelliforme CCNUN1]|uniref:Uncharacterized protein n=1 Tax=Nostoc flagelliforme CCNUN1 TaxID=2038116 RepID=A0A2K8SK91_9NOSO|nr:hypothetical protein COO91_01777 [Nostoc flagelliforme CCNUN1]